MQKTYCDVCGEEIEDDLQERSITIHGFWTPGALSERSGEILPDYDMCMPCARKVLPSNLLELEED